MLTGQGNTRRQCSMWWAGQGQRQCVLFVGLVPALLCWLRPVLMCSMSSVCRYTAGTRVILCTCCCWALFTTNTLLSQKHTLMHHIMNVCMPSITADAPNVLQKPGNSPCKLFGLSVLAGAGSVGRSLILALCWCCICCAFELRTSSESPSGCSGCLCKLPLHSNPYGNSSGIPMLRIAQICQGNSFPPFLTSTTPGLVAVQENTSQQRHILQTAQAAGLLDKITVADAQEVLHCEDPAERLAEIAAAPVPAADVFLSEPFYTSLQSLPPWTQLR